ncbi:BioY family transporter [Microbacterium paludicola]|uniref:Biotin transporter n=1 Tax=Microbacterium paludicola TaxID=300019 RepID=A0A4Y9FXC4_9MICO|nr:biotin transporter BioY [Microbacterium paludicola]MBF0815631.1 biotin transporter BioY [Microbacterium paludicola]TFU33684.1 BioY family transporter [Microbacterium paludicola]
MASSARFESRDLARIAIFAAIIVVLGVAGQVPLPVGVPITLQTLGVMLAGIVLGPVRGAAAVLVVLLLAAVGLPVLSGGRGGLDVFFGPTVGYMIGWIPGVIVTGLLARSGRTRGAGPVWWRVALGAIVGGIGVVYAFGVPGVALVVGIPLADAAVSSLVFIPGDLAKAFVATVLALALWRAYPPAFALAPAAPRAGEPVPAAR